MTNNLTEVSFDDIFYICPRAYLDLQSMRFSVSKFKYIVRTNRFNVHTF